ncbi:MAG: tetratricopeptide repeat protein [candidate division Zixibacteria bacterium]|nr:tetratricopeptide repeat protein [candidate division Zixibacteria bacterium]
MLTAKAYIWRRQGKFRAAIENLSRILELNPRDGDMAMELASTYELIRDYPTASKYCDLLMSMSPDALNGYLFKVDNLVKSRGDTAAAWVVLASLPQQDETAAHLRWAWLLTLERDFQGAINALADLPPIPDPDQTTFVPKAQSTALICHYMKDYIRARAYFDTALVLLDGELRKRPGDHRIHSALGIVYAGLGRKEDAIREGKKGLELYPISKDAYAGSDRINDLASIYILVQVHGS